MANEGSTFTKQNTTAMTLNERFPDDSARIRQERKNNRKKNNDALFTENYQTETDKALANYYAAEFRTWHLQLGIYIAMGVVVIYFCVFTALSYFQ